jgi:hypothetical protein
MQPGFWPETCRVPPGWHRELSTGSRISTENEELTMSLLDIAMAGGVIVLVLLILLRKKTR